MALPVRRRLKTLLFVVAVALSGGAFFTISISTDAATRLAADITDQAGRMPASGSAEQTFEHVPEAWPSGCGGDYMVTITAGGPISVSCDRIYPEVSFTTTAHLPAVTVPVTVSATKAAGQPLVVTLRRQGEHIELVRLQ